MKSFDEIRKLVPYIGWVAGQTYYTELTLAGQRGSVVFGIEGEWEHVSFAPYSRKLPTWDAMCELKDIFWKDEEAAIQIHPKKSEYVNIKKNCLHLWSHKELKLPN